MLGGIDSPALIVSTKYTLGDFYSWLPLNDTLEQGAQRRIVEFQSRREFENFGAFPNDLGARVPVRAAAAARRERPNIEGIWTWTQDGGPWRAGPMTLYLKAGFWQLYELDTVVASALARDPESRRRRRSPPAGRGSGSRTTRPPSPRSSRRWTSRATAIEQGMYIEPFAEQRVFAIGLEPPPMMWIFEWDILTGDSAVLDVLYAISRDATGGDIDAAIAGGEQAVADVEAMRELVPSTDAATWRDASLRDAFLGTLDYEVDVLRLLAAYRAMILHQGSGTTPSRPTSYDAVVGRRATSSRRSRRRTSRRYEGDIDYPAYNLTAAELGVQRADRDLAMAWLARMLLVLALQRGSSSA